MMKKLLSIILLLIASYGVSTATSTPEPKEPVGIMKNVFGDVGYGEGGVSFGLGFRYWDLGISVGMSGIGQSVPPHNYYILATDVLETYKYPTMWVVGDLYYFYDLNDEFTFFANVGYGVGADTVLATKKGETTGAKYYHKTENRSGVTFGAGIQYFIENQIGFGIGYHTRRGPYLQVSYYWY